MGNRGMAFFDHQGVEYTINEPNIADEFSASVDYHTGDYAYYQGKLVRFIAEHPAGAYNANHVTGAWVGKDLKNQAEKTQDLDDFKMIRTYYLQGLLTAGYTKADGTFSTASDWRRTRYIELVGRILFVNIGKATPLNSSVGYNVAYYTKDKAFIQSASFEFPTEGDYKQYIQTPPGAKYVVLSSNAAQTEWSKAYIKQYGDVFKTIDMGTLRQVGLSESLTNGYVKSDGTFGTNSDWRRTGYIPVQGFIYHLHIDAAQPLGSSVGYNIAYFDRNKTFMAAESAEFPANADYDAYVALPEIAEYVIISSVAVSGWSGAYIEYMDVNVRNYADLFGVVGYRRIGSTIYNGYVKYDGTFATNPDWRRTGMIKIGGNKLHVHMVDPQPLGVAVGYNIAFYNKGQSFIQAGSLEFDDYSLFDKYIDIPEYAKYVIISSVAISGWDDSYIEWIDMSGEDAAHTGRDIIVDRSGAGDYTTVTEAVNNAQSGDTIIVRPGNYTGEHIEGFGKQISIIGESPLNTIISCDDSTYDNPALEFSTGVLRNLTFARLNTEGGGYAFHCEDNYQYNKTLLVENCIFKSPKVNSVGMGMRGGCTIIFKDCKFINTDNQGAVFYLHDSNEDEYLGIFNIDFDNCLFMNQGNQILQLQSQEKETSMTYIGFRGCSFFGNGSNNDPTIGATNYAGGTGGEDDFLGLINWRLKGYSTGNNLTVLNVLPTYEGE